MDAGGRIGGSHNGWSRVIAGINRKDSGGNVDVEETS